MEKLTYFNGKIKQKGIFSFAKFYNFAYEWLRYDGYDVHEKQYLEEIEKKGKKVEIQWIATKRVSDYFQFQIQINWLILALNEIEIMKEGKKIKMQIGEPEMKIKGIVVRDYQSKWDTPFLEFMRRIYDDHIIKNRIEEKKDQIIDETEEFIRQCKAYLSLEGYPESHQDYV